MNKAFFIILTFILFNSLTYSQNCLKLDLTDALIKIQSRGVYHNIKILKDEKDNSYISADDDYGEELKWHLNIASHIYKYDILTPPERINTYISVFNEKFVKEKDEEYLWTDHRGEEIVYIKIFRMKSKFKIVQSFSKSFIY